MLTGEPLATPPTAADLAALSRETAFLVDPSGTVRWADERTGRLLGLAPGASLHELAIEGSREKVSRFLEAAGHAPVDGWELMLMAHGAPAALVCRGRPHDGRGVLVVGSLLPQDFDALMTQMSEAMSELSALHRQSERQQREIHQRQREVDRLGTELHESGRGMRALYGELEEKTDSLRAASEVKSRFIANMSHELRTPLTSIVGLTKLLMSRIDGDLSTEQEKQIGLIRRSADEVLEMVNDLLDLSKMQAGHVRLRPAHFTAASLFGTLRGQLRPLAINERVRLVFGDAEGLPALHTDEGKVAQVLRNFVTNALRFTEEGEVRVEAWRADDGQLTFAVTDTGIGIAPEDQPRVWDEFVQIDNPMQRRTKGSGLGLAVSRRLAEALGGRVAVRSTPGVGSAFTLTVPPVHPDVAGLAELAERGRHLDPRLGAPVLIVEDDHQALFLYERYLTGSGFQVLPARSADEAREILSRVKPAAVVLDVMLEGESSWQFLQEMKSNPETCDIPTLVVTVLDRERKARALGADEFYVKPLDKDWLLRKLKSLARKGPVDKVLVIDDDEVARYLLRRLLAETEYRLLEAHDGHEGIRLAREQRPQVIFLDFVLPSMTAFDVLDDLKLHPETRNIPVIISTSKQLDDDERSRLQQGAAAIITKDKLSREVALTRIREALTSAIGTGTGAFGTGAVSIVTAGGGGEGNGNGDGR